MRESTRIALLMLCAGLVATSSVHAAELQWWSHWAIEDNKKVVLFEAKRRFEAKNPGNTVTITFYEKKNMFTALRAAFTAGSGFPDVVYYDIDAPEFMAAGWLADLSTGIRWENIEPYGKAFWTRPGPGGKIGTWALPIEAASDELYYNKKIFKQLGITVPPGGAFSQEQFKDVVEKCTKAGYAAFATGAADRDWAAHYMPNGMLLDKLGPDDTLRLFKGELSWKDPRVVEVFHYYKELIDLGAYSKALSSMTLAEAHRYFHTDQKACMFPVGSWYTGRAFVAPEKGGQPKDFELGMMNYPLMKDGKGHNQRARWFRHLLRRCPDHSVRRLKPESTGISVVFLHARSFQSDHVRESDHKQSGPASKPSRRRQTRNHRIAIFFAVRARNPQSIALRETMEPFTPKSAYL